MNTVKLRDGTEAPKALVAVTMRSLRALWNEELAEGSPITVYEAWKLATEPSHELFGNAVQILKSLSFLDGNGRLHKQIKDVIRNAVRRGSSEFDLSLIDPVPGERELPVGWEWQERTTRPAARRHPQKGVTLLVSQTEGGWHGQVNDETGLHPVGVFPGVPWHAAFETDRAYVSR